MKHSNCVLLKEDWELISTWLHIQYMTQTPILGYLSPLQRCPSHWCWHLLLHLPEHTGGSFSLSSAGSAQERWVIQLKMPGMAFLSPNNPCSEHLIFLYYVEGLYNVVSLDASPKWVTLLHCSVLHPSILFWHDLIVLFFSPVYSGLFPRDEEEWWCVGWLWWHTGGLHP